MIYVTSDSHFGHDAIRDYSSRPFTTVEEMDATMIENWNAIVRDDDTVICLGDFTLGGWEQAAWYFRKLTGHIKVLGNPWHHDKRWLPKTGVGYSPFRSRSDHDVEILLPIHVLELKEYAVDGHPLPVILCHYPIARWDRKHFGAIHLYGHTHQHCVDLGPRAINICVEQADYYPVSLIGLVESALMEPFGVGTT